MGRLTDSWGHSVIPRPPGRLDLVWHTLSMKAASNRRNLHGILTYIVKLVRGTRKRDCEKAWTRGANATLRSHDLRLKPPFYTSCATSSRPSPEAIDAFPGLS